MERAISRQAVAEWRDRQILTAAALLNQKGIEARSAFEREVEQATAAEALFNQAAFVNARIDALLKDSLTASLPDYLVVASRELVSIDSRFKPLGKALTRADAIALPEIADPSPALNASAEAPAAEATLTEQPSVGSKRALSGLPTRLAKRAATLAQGAGSAADDVVQDTLGLKKRLRAAAAQRIASTWMGESQDPRSPLAQIVALIDETSYAARMALS